MGIFLQALDAVVGVGAAQLVEGAAVGLLHPVDHGVPGKGDQPRLLVHRVVGEHHHGIGVAADLVAGHQQEGVGVILPHRPRVLHRILRGKGKLPVRPGANHLGHVLKAQGRRQQEGDHNTDDGGHKDHAAPFDLVRQFGPHFAAVLAFRQAGDTLRLFHVRLIKPGEIRPRLVHGCNSSAGMLPLALLHGIQHAGKKLLVSVRLPAGMRLQKSFQLLYVHVIPIAQDRNHV